MRSRGEQALQKAQRLPWLGWSFDKDGVASSHLTAVHNNRHDTGASGYRLIFSAQHQLLHQAGLKGVDLPAGRAQASNFHESLFTKMKPRTFWKRKKVDAACCDVFAQFASSECVTQQGKFREQFLLQEMYLHEVVCRWLLTFEVQVLHGGTTVRVAFYAETCEQLDGKLRLLAEAMFRIQTNSRDSRCCKWPAVRH